MADELLGLRKGIEAGVQGFFDAQNQKYRKMEMESRLNAQKKNEERQAFMDQVSLYKAGLMKDEGGGLLERPLSEREQADFDYKQAKIAEERRFGLQKRAGELRKERSGLPTTKATQQVAASFNRVRNAAENPSPAGDLALIFNYMKMLDPGSTVREGEFANAQNAGSVPTKIMALYNSVAEGQRLTQGQRKDFLSQAEGQYNAQSSLQRKIDEKFRQIAQANGLPLDQVIVDFEADPVAKKQLTDLAKQEVEKESPGLLDKVSGFFRKGRGDMGLIPKAQAKPKAGSVKKYQGKTYKLVGDEWVEQ